MRFTRRAVMAIALPFALAAALHAGDAEEALVVSHQLPSFAGFAPVGGQRAFSVGGVWCNLGSAPAAWDEQSSAHPVVGTNLLRIEDGELRHLAASWAFHLLCPVEQNACGTCTPTGVCSGWLGAGCSTTSTASALGNQSLLAPRSLVNAATGVPAFPFSAPPPSDALSRRCFAPLSEMDPAGHPGAAFAFQAVTIHPSSGDPSERSIVRPISAASLLTGGGFAGPASAATSAIDWWVAMVPGVESVSVDLRDDGRVLVAASVSPIAPGQWRYRYAVENLNSHDGIRSVRVPLGLGSASEPSFAFPPSHSGESVSNEPWTIAVGADITWSTDTFATDPNSNAVRWGTTYTMSFVSNRPPVVGTLELDRFRSGATFEVNLPRPATPDLDGDGTIGAGDLAILLGAWSPRRTCASCPADLTGDGAVDAADLAILLGSWNG